MVFAIGRAVSRLVSAKAEILSARVSDRPFAGLVREMKDGYPPVLGQIDQAQGLRLRNRQGARLSLGAQGWLERCCACGRQVNGGCGAARMRRFPGAARPGHRTPWLGRPTREIEAVNLSNDRVASDTVAQAPGNLAGAQTLRP